MSFLSSSRFQFLFIAIQGGLLGPTPRFKATLQAANWRSTVLQVELLANVSRPLKQASSL
jgi:hypothetical protein